MLSENITKQMWKAYEEAKRSSAHHGMFEARDGYLYAIIQIPFPEKKLNNKKYLNMAISRLSNMVKANARFLKEKNINVKDIFKNTPKIRAMINKEQYGLKTKIN